MDVELAVNSFWFIAILTAVLYITKKRSEKKKEFKLIKLAFQISLFISVCLIAVCLYLLILKN